MRVFLSYTTQDHEVADRLRSALKARRPGLDIYFAPKRNEVGAYWIERLGTELEAADAIILVIGRRVGTWQELEYYDALKRNRISGRPLITPILLAETAPGLPFFDQFHRLRLTDLGFDDLIGLTLHALDGAKSDDLESPWRLINPYPGLPALGTQDAAYFFGRETLSGEILSQIESHPDKIHTLIGNSGVGKSSLAMAGVLAALRSRLWPGDWDRNWPAAMDQSHTWPVIIVKPGETPVKALTQAFTALWLESPADIEKEALKWRRLLLGESSLSSLIAAALEQLSKQNDSAQPERLVLYVDQAEELYSQSEAKEAQRFSSLLADAVINSNLIVMISLRSDYYGRLQEDTHLFKASTTIDVPPLEQTYIEQIIRLPAERLQVQFEDPDLIPLIAESTAREPGAMPMLSDLLSDAWNIMMEATNSDGVLRFPFQIVDISRAFAEKTERFFSTHRNQEEVLKRLFTLKLAHVTKEGEVVRRRSHRSECSDAEWLLVEAMAGRDWRLVSTGVEVGEPVAEVAHEALLRNWPRLIRWLDESREFLIWKGQLEPDRVIWQQAGTANRSRALLTGLRLEKAVYWRSSRADDLTKAEGQFIADSAQAAEQGARRRVRIQRILKISLLFVSVLAASFLWQTNVAIRAEKQANTARQKAEQQTSLAEARRLAISAEKVLDENIGETTLAGLLSVESLKRTPTPEGKRVLRRILKLTPEEFRPVKTPWPWSTILHSPDRKLTAFYRRRGRGSPAAGKVVLIDTKSWQVDDHYHQHGRIWPIISNNGRWLALAGYGRRVQVIDLQTGRVTVDEYQDDMIDAVFGPNGRLYVARTDGVIEVRAAPDWQIVGKLNYPVKKDRAYNVEIEVSKNGKRILLLAHRQNTFLIDVDTGALIELKGHQYNARGGIFTPSGSHVVTRAWFDEMIVWDSQNGIAQGVYKHDSVINALAITPDGERIISATQAGIIFIRDAKTGKIERRLTHDGGVNAVAVSENGLYLAAASHNWSASLWNLDNGKKLLNLPHSDEVWTVEFGANDQTILSGGKDRVLRVFDTKTGKQLQHFEMDNGITAIAHNSVSGTLAVGVRATENEQAWTDLILVDRQTGEKVSQIEHNGGFYKMIFSPDSRALVTLTSGEGDVKIWDTDTGRLKLAPKLTANSLFFSPDGSRLITGDSSGETVIVNASDGTRVATVGEPGGIETVSVAPDQRTITTFGQDRSFRGWDAITGEALWQRQSNRPNHDGLTISADGQRYIDLSVDRKNIEIGEVRTGRSIATIPAGKGSSRLLSQDGRRLLKTRRYLYDPSDPESTYSEVELWNVDEGVRLMKQRYEYRLLFSQLLPGKRFAILAGGTNFKDGVLDVIDADIGNQQWSLPIQGWIGKVLVPKHGNDFLIIGTGTKRQIREIATGNLISEISGSGIFTGDAVHIGKQILIAEPQSLRSNDYAITIRDIQSGILRKKIPVDGYIREFAMSSDGHLLFAALSNDYINGVKVWRANDLSEIRFIQMNDTPMNLIPLIDPDLLAVRDFRGTFRVWRISSGREEFRLSHTFTAKGTQSASTANRVATWQGASIRVWDTDTGSEIAHRQAHGKVSSLEISPDGRMVAYLTDSKQAAKRGGDYKPLVIWEPDDKNPPTVVPMQAPSKVMFDPLGRFLVVLHRDATVQILDVATLRTVANIRALSGSKVDNVRFSVDGDLLFISENKNHKKMGLRVFSFNPLREITRVDDQRLTESAPDARNMMTWDGDSQWRSWSPLASDADELLWNIPTYYSLLPIPNTGRLLGYETRTGVEVFDLVEGKRTAVVPVDKDQYLRSVAIDEAGKHVAIAVDDYDSDGQVFIRAVNGSSDIARLQTGISMYAMAFVNGSDSIVMSDTPGLSKDSIESALWLWKWRSGDLLKLSQDNPINTIAVSPNGLFFATAEGAVHFDTHEALGNPQIRIWDAQTGKELQQIVQSSIVHDVAFSPDGQYLAVKLDNTVLVYQTKAWTLMQKFDLGRENRGRGKIAFGIDNRVVVGSYGNTITIWSLDGREQRFLRHSNRFFSFELSNDGRWLVTKEEDALRVWDVETGKENFRAKFDDASHPIHAFLGSDGDTLVANVRGRLIRIPWRSKELISDACYRFTRNMTEEEWQRFFDQESYEDTCEGKAEFNKES